MKSWFFRESTLPRTILDSVGAPKKIKRNDQIPESRPEHADDQNGKENPGKGEGDVDDAHDGFVGPAAEKSGDQTEECSKHDRAERSDGGDKERDTGAENQARKCIAAKIVSAHDVSSRGRFEPRSFRLCSCGLYGAITGRGDGDRQ